jgi:hypothetical protein
VPAVIIPYRLLRGRMECGIMRPSEFFSALQLLPFLYASQPAHRVVQPWRTEAQGCPPRKMRGRQDGVYRLSRQPRASTRLMLSGFVTLQVIRCDARARTIAYCIVLLPFFPFLPPGVIETSTVHRVLPLGRSRPLHFHVSNCSEYFPSPDQ